MGQAAAQDLGSFRFSNEIEDLEAPTAKIGRWEFCDSENRPKFRFVGMATIEDAAGHIPLSDSAAITPERCNVNEFCRLPSFVKKLELLKARAEKFLPDNVQITYGMSPWNPSSAYDEVTLRVFDRKGCVIAKDYLWRSIIDYRNPLNPEGLVPLPVRDSLFMSKAYHSAKNLVKDSRGHTADNPFIRQRPFDGYQSLI